MMWSAGAWFLWSGMVWAFFTGLALWLLALLLWPVRAAEREPPAGSTAQEADGAEESGSRAQVASG